MTIRTGLQLGLLIAIAAAAAPAASSAGPLQQQVEALAKQLDLRYGRSQRVLAERRAELAAVLAAWNDLPDDAKASAEARAQLAGWLDEALAVAMPGGSGRLPAAPEFRPIEVLPAEPPRVEAAPSEAPPASDFTSEPPAAQAAPAESRMLDPVRPSREGPLAIGESASRPGPTPPLLPETQRDSSAPQAREVAKPVSREERSDDPVASGPSQSASGPSEGKWSRHPAAAPLEWRDPFADDPDASPNPLRSGTRRESLKPLRGESSDARVDLDHLAAQIRGYNAEVRALHRLLTVADRSPETRQSQPALRRLEERLADLQERQAFLETYRDRVSRAERWGLPELASSDVLRELVRREKDRTADPRRRGADTGAGKGAMRLGAALA
ncbi:hypothetical protein [Botrimarina sp.]|uniref:hypothetical protein n=1 Tax=Botrimarina sp. TaxID=2795802 RepID=UPI0032ED3CC8